MKIGIVATHSFPIPWKTHTGDVVILDLAFGLRLLGHQVTVYAPVGTKVPEGCQLLDMPCAFGKYPPPAEQCERECYEKNKKALLSEDIVHDFSVSKQVAWSLVSEGKTNVIGTPLGGTWNNLAKPMNVAVWSEAMRGRGMRGACDYEGTRFKQWMNCGQSKISDAKVVYGGVDCQLYDDPDLGAKKENFILWMNRWHPAKGYEEAIKLALVTGCELVMAGEHPDNETYAFQRECALGALHMAKGASNIHFEFLPGDPDHHERKRQLYRKAKALLYPVQFHEPFGLSQAEALASWTPVIGTRMGSVPEVVEHGRTGIVCNNNIEDLTAGHEQVGKILPRICRESAVQRFSRLVMAKNYLELYKDVVHGKNWG
jgi:glycosyltransferase involved in cell wall biosynthesis